MNIFLGNLGLNSYMTFLLVSFQNMFGISSTNQIKLLKEFSQQVFLFMS